MINIPVYRPYLTKENLKYVHDAIDSGWISSQGKYLDMTESLLKEITGKQYCILTNNGTSATHLLAYTLKKVDPEINRVICPTNVFIAALNSFRVNPIFELWPIDANDETWNLDIDLLPNLKTPFWKKTALLAVSNLGNPINVPKIKSIYPELMIVEDNCEGFLGKTWGKPTGFLSIAQSISFFGNKSLTSGEGGAFLTDNKEIYEEMFHRRGQGFTNEKFVFSGIGYNYRMTNVQAAILYGQITTLNEIRERKQHVFDTYLKELKGVEGISFQKPEELSEPANWLFGIRVKNKNILMETLLNHGIETRPMFPPCNYHTHMPKGIYPVAEKIYQEAVVLPSYPELSKNEITQICDIIKNNL